MRYSYRWDVTAEDVWGATLPEPAHDRCWPYGRRHVRLRGAVRVEHPYVLKGYAPSEVVTVTLANGRSLRGYVKRGWPVNEGREQWLPSRLVMWERRPFVAIGYGRLTGESVSGLVVGAMGVFIFGLYLRAWLRERKALAGEPPRDMIA
jgi:hypothetical protein